MVFGQVNKFFGRYQKQFVRSCNIVLFGVAIGVVAFAAAAAVVAIVVGVVG